MYGLSSSGESGEELRRLWLAMYAGDLRFGVRDMRREAEANGWPKRDGNAFDKFRDRNSWIANTLRKSFYTEAKAIEKKAKSE